MCEGENFGEAFFRSNFSDNNASTIQQFLSTAATSSLLILPHFFANAVTNEEEAPTKLTDVYFGVGRFWHIQHKFVEAEAQLLKWNGSDFASRTANAGGLS